jgi:hypothetical protein
VVLTFTAPSPNQETDVLSQRNHACLLGILHSTLQRVDSAVIMKRQQLTTGHLLDACKKEERVFDNQQ